MRNSNSVYKYVLVSQELFEKLRGQRMLRCVLCAKRVAGEQAWGGVTFLQREGLITGPHDARATSRALVGARQQGDDVIDLDGKEEGGGKDAGTYSQWPGKLPVDEGGSNLGKRKDMDGAMMQQGKKTRQPAIKEALGYDGAAKHKKLWLRFVYSNQLAFNIFRSPTSKAYTTHFRDKPPSVPVIWPFENEVTAMDTVVEMAIDVVAGLKDIQETFNHTGTTTLFDGRKSHDGRPIVNFLAAAGARGVMMWSTLNREGESDDALAVLGRWMLVFRDFRSNRVNAICTDSTTGPWCMDIIERARAVVHFIKMHSRAHFLFRRESRHLGLLYSCETRFAFVYTMLERLDAVRRPLEVARVKVLADVDPSIQAMARDMEARRELKTVGRVMLATAGAGVHSFHENVRDMVVDYVVLEGGGATAHTQTLESRGRDGITVVDDDHTDAVAEEAGGEEDLPSRLMRGERRTTTHGDAVDAIDFLCLLLFRGMTASCSFDTFHYFVSH
ncbi:hypothetical protein CBR_g48742 [Chara braunii]|uniref:DUF659 domain-containing protein n=1 Tax=Chara braunii TaxID=69332 RepID=A0A388K4W8_CHABU|nr:hypothetical protein CBR_g48742 [Chara braunii]|eukprot:GBG64993.1 hypothetical protein CBR_g48742 [Chara braunii]